MKMKFELVQIDPIAVFLQVPEDAARDVVNDIIEEYNWEVAFDSWDRIDVSDVPAVYQEALNG